MKTLSFLLMLLSFGLATPSLAQLTLRHGTLMPGNGMSESAQYRLVSVIGWADLSQHADTTWVLIEGPWIPRNHDTSAVGGPETQAHRLSLSNIQPNPIGQSGLIHFNVPGINGEKSPLTMAIYDVTGRRVRTLVSGEMQSGPQVAIWDGRDDSGKALANGIYWCQIQCKNNRATKKLAVIR
ncbi:MAG: T9SS type A sorting domain-containing protein [Candidatus Nomurabacteria bacterium]|nr:MAG: T9SS type A sorting domain-containing protein [Candidatus Nomurabacteria bacterium]